jgi:hypothetical protein
MVEKLLYIGGLKNMENDLIIRFEKEDRKIVVNISQPDLAQLIHVIVAERLNVSKENIEISTENGEFDKEEFQEILISVHEEFSQEIEKFYDNIQRDIKTYYSYEDLGDIIIQKLKQDQQDEIIEG